MVRWYAASYKGVNEQDLNGVVGWIRDTMIDASDVCMKRVTKRNKQTSPSWWNEEIDGARSDVIRLRRKWTRARRRNANQEEISALAKTYKAPKKILSRLILRAKKKCVEGLGCSDR